MSEAPAARLPDPRAGTLPGGSPRGVCREPFPGWARLYLAILPIGLPVAWLVEGSDFLLVIGIAGMFGEALRRGRWRLRLADGLFLGFVGIACLGADIGTHPWFFVFHLGAMVFLFLGSRALSTAVRDGRDLAGAMAWASRLFLPVIAGYAGLFVLYRLGFQGWPAGVFTGKLTFPFRFSNQLGGYLLGALPLTLGCGWKSPTGRMFLYAGTLVVLAGVASRSAVLVGLLEFAVLEALCFREDPLPPWFRLIALFCLIAGMGFLLSEEWTFLRAIGASGSLTYGSDPPRLDQLRQAVELLPYWVQGVGLGCFYGGFGLEIHMTPVSLLAETGLLGLALLGCWTAVTVLPAARLARTGNAEGRGEARFLLVAIGAMLAYSCFHNLLRTRFLWMLLGLAGGLGSVAAPDGGQPA